MKGSDRPVAPDGYVLALELLAGRDYSREELRRKLASRGVDAPAIDEVLERLSSQRLMDDAAFAGRWVESAMRSGRGVGAKLLFDLQRKGVARETAQKAVADAAAETPAERVLAEIVTRRFTSFNHATATQKERQRVYGYLLRRGFPLSSIISYFNCQDTECER